MPSEFPLGCPPAVSLHPQWTVEDLLTQSLKYRCSSDPGPYGPLLPALCPLHMETLVCLQSWSVSPLSCGSHCSQSLLTFKAKYSRGFLLLMPEPHVGGPDIRTRLSTLVRRNYCMIIIFQSMQFAQPTRHGTWLYPECSPLSLSWHWLLVWYSHLIWCRFKSRFCWRLLSSCEFWCAPERRVSSVLLLHHLVSLSNLILAECSLDTKLYHEQ